MYINGVWENPDKVLEVTNPANGEVIGSVPDGGREDAARAIDAVAKAFPAWRWRWGKKIPKRKQYKTH